MLIYGIDPGPTESALGIVHLSAPGAMPILEEATKMGNASLFNRLEAYVADASAIGYAIGIEDPRAYSMQKTSQDILETVKIVGAVGYLLNRAGHLNRYVEISRSEIRGHVCGNGRAGDREIREAVLDRWGMLKLAGQRKLPAPFEGVKGDAWQAIGVCLAVEARWRAGWPVK